jgi:hypothetical protein
MTSLRLCVGCDAAGRLSAELIDAPRGSSRMCGAATDAEAAGSTRRQQWSRM